MTDTITSDRAATKRKIRIFINSQPYFTPEQKMTGAELLALAGLPETNQIFLEVPGPGEDQAIASDQDVKLRSGQKFYDVPVGTFG